MLQPVIPSQKRGAYDWGGAGEDFWRAGDAVCLDLGSGFHECYVFYYTESSCAIRIYAFVCLYALLINIQMVLCGVRYDGKKPGTQPGTYEMLSKYLLGA